MQESLIVLSCNARYSTELSSNALGSITRIENRYKRIENAKAMLEQKLEQLNKDRNSAEAEYNKPFQHAALLEEKLCRQRELEHELNLDEKVEEITDAA